MSKTEGQRLEEDSANLHGLASLIDLGIHSRRDSSGLHPPYQPTPTNTDNHRNSNQTLNPATIASGSGISRGRGAVSANGTGTVGEALAAAAAVACSAPGREYMSEHRKKPALNKKESMPLTRSRKS
jgi:hypothetical protein